MEPLPCVGQRNDRTPCRQAPRYICDKGHVICHQHAVRLGGESKRRNQDRKCLLCLSLNLIDLKAVPVQYERRRLRDSDTGVLDARMLEQTRLAIDLFKQQSVK